MEEEYAKAERIVKDIDEKLSILDLSGKFLTGVGILKTESFQQKIPRDYKGQFYIHVMGVNELIQSGQLKLDKYIENILVLTD